jgi:hypothetical protein
MASERAIRIEADGVRLYAILGDSPVAAAVWEALPLEGKARVLPGEVALEAVVHCEPILPPRPEAKSGDLGWRGSPPTLSFFHASAEPGTPAPPIPSPEPVQIFGRITGDATRLARVRDGARIRVTALEG